MMFSIVDTSSCLPATMGILTSGDSLLSVPVFENYMLWAEESLSCSCVLCCIDVLWGLCQHVAWHQARCNLIWLKLNEPERDDEHEMSMSMSLSMSTERVCEPEHEH